jgi:hypothetical protein
VLKLVTEQPLSRFAETARLSERRLRRVYVISPWIVQRENEFFALGKLLVTVRSARARLSVITREPTFESHGRAISAIRNTVPEADIVFLPSLHAKLYLLQSETLKAALFGSPNFTPQGNSLNRELAADVRALRSTDAESEFIDDLFSYARQLMSEEDARFVVRGRWAT